MKVDLEAVEQNNIIKETQRKIYLDICNKCIREYNTINCSISGCIYYEFQKNKDK